MITNDGAAVLSRAVGLSRAVVVVALVGALALRVTGAPGVVAWVVVGVGLLAGLPHGAVDHLVLARLSTWPTAAVVAGYAGSAMGAWGLLTWGGAVAVGTILALSLLHFGLGELESHRAQGAAPGSLVTTAALAVAGTSALLLPLVRGGPEVTAVTQQVSPGLAALLATPDARVGTAVLWAAAVAVAGAVAARARRTAVLVDLGLVAGLALVAPPLVAFAVWFGGWHAVRHTARLLVVEPGCAALVQRGSTGAAVRRLARLSALPTLAALVALAVLGTLTASASDPAEATASAVRVLLALTVPHVLVVAWLDRDVVAVRSAVSAGARGGRMPRC